MQRINLTKYTTNSIRSVHYCSKAIFGKRGLSQVFSFIRRSKFKTLKYAHMLCNSVSSGKFTVKSSSTYMYVFVVVIETLQ